ncbi:MAG TPA: rhomboid family intramembrane serine protease [Anaerolineaceae bacterium]|nr:rhomboid family intramembrane serine protease [Anaerolineaceae bacterium]
MNNTSTFSNPNSSGNTPPISRPYQPGERQPTQVGVRLPKTQPLVTYTMMGLCIFVYLLQVLSQTFLGTDYLVLYGAKINQYILAGEFWRLITPMFLHASIIHIAFNMYALFVLGPGLERFYGHKRFLALYMIGGFAGNVLSFLFSPDSSIGASTAIFALVSAQGIFIYKNRFLFGKNARSLIINTIGIVIINFVFGLAPQSNVDNFGHLGGLLGGLAFAWFAGPVFKVSGLMPDLYLEDQTSSSQVVMSGLIVTLIFCMLAALKFIFPGLNQ